MASSNTTGESSAQDSSDGFELAGSRKKKRRLRSNQLSKENSPQATAVSFASVVERLIHTNHH
jgi:hypothetical protein